MLKISIPCEITVCVPDDFSSSAVTYILLEWEDWPERELGFLRQWMKPGMIAVDVGSEYGLYCLTMARMTGVEGRVFAFENQPTILPYLLAGIQENAFTNLSLFPDQNEAEYSSDLKIESLHLTRGRDQALEDHDISQWLGTLARERVDFIRLTQTAWISGSMQELADILEKNSPLVLFTVDEKNYAHAACFFQKNGYFLYKFVAGLGVLVPYTRGEMPCFYPLNLFACSYDRLISLAEEGLASLPVEDVFFPSIPSRYLYDSLQNETWSCNLLSLWEKVIYQQDNEPFLYYKEALQAYLFVKNNQVTPGTRIVLTRYAYDILKALKTGNPEKIIYLSSFARVAREIGETTEACACLEDIIKSWQQVDILMFNEPFLPVHARFEKIRADTNFNDWFMGGVYEALLECSSVSSFYKLDERFEYLEKALLLSCANDRLKKQYRMIGLIKERRSDVEQKSTSLSTAMSCVAPFGKKPLLTICIPTFNRANILKLTLEHLLQEIKQDETEIIVTDNASPDHTQQIISEYEAKFLYFKTVRHANNLGPAKNVYSGMSMATGAFVYIICDDDEIHYDAVRNIVLFMQAESDVSAVYGGYQEWHRETNNILGVHSPAYAKFRKNDRIGILKGCGLLWNPVMRTSIVQRFFSCEELQSWYQWPLVSVLIENGDIVVVPDLLYKHAHTIPRYEFNLTESWFHDHHRAQYEIYQGMIGPVDKNYFAGFVNDRVGPAYLQGLRFAMEKKEYMVARQFLLRAKAYGFVNEDFARQWERENMVSMIIEKIGIEVQVRPYITEVIFNRDIRLKIIKEGFSEQFNNYGVKNMAPDEWQMHPLHENQFLITYSYNSNIMIEPSQYRAVADIMQYCRVSDA